MHSDDPHSSNIGMGILAWVSAFAASWTVIQAMTNTPGLALVFSVFIGLIAFDLARRSLIAAAIVFLISMLVIIINGLFYLAA